MAFFAKCWTDEHFEGWICFVKHEFKLTIAHLPCYGHGSTARAETGPVLS